MASILIVEDDEFNRDMLSRRLARYAYEVLVALNGVEAIEIAHAESPDLILMDIGLPIMDGLEATKHLKADRKTQQIPIITLTAHAFEDDVIASRHAGSDDFETKPVDMPRLLSKIQALLP